MAAPPAANAAPIVDKAQLIDSLAQGAKAESAFRIGTEHEKFVFHRENLRPATYDEPAGIRWLLERFADRFEWQIVRENDLPVALSRKGASVSLEPGGQLELSGAPLASIHDTCRESNGHLRELKELTEPAGIGLLGIGAQPKWSLAETPTMPKGRYAIMADYMPKRGTLGLDMMHRTATIQVNLDFLSEADMVKKFRVGLALQPLATALFANSPFLDGKPTGFQSYRSHVWTDVDPDRSGMLPFVFEEGFGFEQYVDYVLDVPMYFVYRDGRYVDASGQSFRSFLKGELPALPGEKPTMADWSDHQTTVFPEVRLKTFLEMRGADAGPWSTICALPALWVGLLYDGTALDAAWDLVKDWDDPERARLRATIPAKGLATPYLDGTILPLARRVLEIAEAGLKARGRIDLDGLDESKYLEPLWDVVESGRTPADEKLALFASEWGGKVEPVFTRYAF